MSLDPSTEIRSSTREPAQGSVPRIGNQDQPPLPHARAARNFNSIRRWALASADCVAVLVGILLAESFSKLWPGSLEWALLMLPAWILFAKLNNLYDHDHRRIRHSTFDEIPAVLASAVFTVVSIKGLTELLSAPKIPSAALIIIGGTAFLLSLVLRGMVRYVISAASHGQTTVIVGSSDKAGLVARRLAGHPEAGINLVGFVAVTPNGASSGPAAEGLQYFGTPGDLPRIARNLSVRRVVVADDDLSSRALGRIIDDCRNAGVGVTMVPSNMEVLGPETELNRVAEVPMLDFHFSDPPRSTLTIKRALDIGASGTLLTLTAPLLLLAAVLIKIDSRGPVFFRQTRIGRGGRPFTMYKLRTMVADAEARLDELINLDDLEEPAFKIANDPRVTRVGRILRRTSLDEVPQFINVLKGDMSLVGPRPEEEAVVALYDERQRQRLSVKPGLTGPMQVHGRGNLSFEERLALERDYLDNLSIGGDLAILLRTPRAVVRGEGSL